MSLFYKSFAYLRKDLLTDVSYRLSFLARWVGIIISVYTFFYLAKLMGGSSGKYLEVYGGDYFAFVLIGLATMSYLNAAINGFVGQVLYEQRSGVLEIFLSLPTKFPAMLFLLTLYNLFMGTLASGLFLLMGKILGIDFSHAHLPAFILIVLLATVAFLSLGVTAASLILVFKRGDPVTWVVTNIFWLFGGAYFPISVFPEHLQKVSFYLPSTYALEGLRLSLLQGYSPAMLKDTIFVLMCFAFSLVLLALFSLKTAFYYAKKKGVILLH